MGELSGVADLLVDVETSRISPHADARQSFRASPDKKKHAKIVNEPATDSGSEDDASEKASSESEEEKGKMVSLLAQSWSGTPRADSEGGSSDDSI